MASFQNISFRLLWCPFLTRCSPAKFNITKTPKYCTGNPEHTTTRDTGTREQGGTSNPESGTHEEYETGPAFRLVSGVAGNAASLYPICPCRERTCQKNEETWRLSRFWRFRRWCKCSEAEYSCLTERVVIPQTLPTKHLPRTASNQEALSVFRQIWSMYLPVEVLT
ncbi:uncharacterized protein LOC134787620 [Penaeus indicus]|uniref:uncharacterized protein LOC134787620 n=1 Tax=Penaeus indicus TaxID=29960 RepID=UPI00300BFD6F